MKPPYHSKIRFSRQFFTDAIRPCRALGKGAWLLRLTSWWGVTIWTNHEGPIEGFACCGGEVARSRGCYVAGRGTWLAAHTGCARSPVLLINGCVTYYYWGVTEQSAGRGSPHRPGARGGGVGSGGGAGRADGAGICSLPSRDWLPLRVYALYLYAIGSRSGYMLSTLTRLAPAP
eukprot:1193678-Prorocentrum_minimum.AAC.3